MNIDNFLDKDFARQILEAECQEDILAVLQGRGYNISANDIPVVLQFAEKVEKGEITQSTIRQFLEIAADGELSDEVLEQVAGGGIFSCISNFIKKIINKYNSWSFDGEYPDNGAHKLG